MIPRAFNYYEITFSLIFHYNHRVNQRTMEVNSYIKERNGTIEKKTRKESSFLILSAE